MSERISRDLMALEIVQTVAKRSTCNRAKVGCVITQDGRIVSTGYAGAPSGMDHCSKETCNQEAACTRTVHAEAGAIAYAARAGVALEGSTLYCNYSPCLDCAKLIINSGIRRVVYEKAYRKTEGLRFLVEAGIAAAQYGSQS